MTQTEHNETFGLGPAPAGPLPEMPDPPAAQPAQKGPDASAAQAADPAASAQKPRTRRVGTFTMGVTLILTGAALCAGLILPGFDLLTLARLAPLVLVALGCEILWWSAHQSSVRIKYDLLSVFVCLVLLAVSVGLALLPSLWRYYGPSRSLTETRLANELVDTAYPALRGLGLRNLSVNISLAAPEFDPDMGIGQLTAEDYVGVTVSLRGPFADSAEFADACTAVREVLRGLEVKMRYVDFYCDSDTDHYETTIYSLFDWDATAAQIAGQVEHQIYLPGEDTWMEEQNYRLAGAYEEGWLMGGEAAPGEPVPGYSDDETLQRAFAQGWQTGQENREETRPTGGQDGGETAPAAQPPAVTEEETGGAVTPGEAGTVSPGEADAGAVTPEDETGSPGDADAAA